MPNYGTPIDPKEAPPPPQRQAPTLVPGQPLDPAQAPPKPEPRLVPMPSPGQQADPSQAPPRLVPQAPQVSAGQQLQQVPPRSEQQAPTITPVSLDPRTPPQNLPAGVAPKLVNWSVTRDGLAPRLGFGVVGPSGLSSSHSFFGNSGIQLFAEYVDVSPVASPVQTVAAFSNDTYFLYLNGAVSPVWVQSNYSSAITNDPLSTAPTDATLIYEPVADQNAVVFCNLNDQSFIWQGPNYAPSANTFSSLTNAPRARAVAYFDTRVVFGNVLGLSGAADLRIPQRLVWSARGDPTIYTEPEGGTEDLVSMQGSILRLVEDGDRLVIVGSREIWQGYKAAFPFDFQFAPLDKTMGASEARTVVKTPIGIIFQGYDANVYLLPKGGNAVQPIGTPVWRQLMREIRPNAADGWAVYDSRLGEYQLFQSSVDYPGPTLNNPHRGVCFNIYDQTWSQKSFAVFFGAGIMLQAEPNAGGPVLYLGTSTGTVAAARSAWLQTSVASANTLDFSSAFSAVALFPIGNPNPAQKLYVRDMILDYSNSSVPSGSSVTLAFSADFGQTYDTQIGVALPYAEFSRQTVVNVGYAAVYPSVEVRYESQVSGHMLRIQRLTAMVEGIGQTAVGVS